MESLTCGVVYPRQNNRRGTNIGSKSFTKDLRARAIENQCYVVAAAQGGRHNEKRETWGHSMIIDPWGSVLDCLEKGEGIALANIDIDYLNDIRARMPVREQQKL